MSSAAENQNQDYVLGITLGLLGSIAINTGNNIQSLGLKALQSQAKVGPEPDAAAPSRRASSTKRISTLSLPRVNVPRRKGSLPWASPGARTAPSDVNDEGSGSESQSQETAEPGPSAAASRRRASSISIPSATSLGPPTDERLTKRKVSLPRLSPGPRRKGSLPFLSPGQRTTPADENSEGSEPEFVVVKVGKKSPLQSMTWIVGTIVFVSGSLLNFASYAFAAQSMLASLESIQFVTNLIFGKFMLGATVTQTMVAGTCLVVTGTVMAVQFSSKETLELNTEDIKRLYHNPGYLMYLAFLGCFTAILHVVYKRLDERKRASNAVKHSDVILPCVYAVSSALFGTQSVVQAKVLAELLAVHSKGDENVFASWFTYLTLLIWILTATVWLKRLNDALKRFNPLFIIPLLQCSFIFFAIVSGGIFFQEFNAFTLSQWLGFWFGIVVMFSGLVLLTPRPKGSRDDELQRALVNLLLEGRSASVPSAERTPRSPAPTPRGSPDGSGGEDRGGGGGGGQRTPRLSRENFAAAAHHALDAVREALVGDPCARTLAEAMLLNTVDEGERRRRRGALERLLRLIKENPISADGYGEEITGLLRDLELEVPEATPPAPSGPDVRDAERRLAATQERLRTRIVLEIEQNRSPNPGGAGTWTPRGDGATLLLARDLKGQFDTPPASDSNGA